LDAQNSTARRRSASPGKGPSASRSSETMADVRFEAPPHLRIRRPYDEGSFSVTVRQANNPENQEPSYPLRWCRGQAEQPMTLSLLFAQTGDQRGSRKSAPWRRNPMWQAGPAQHMQATHAPKTPQADRRRPRRPVDTHDGTKHPTSPEIPQQETRRRTTKTPQPEGNVIAAGIPATCSAARKDAMEIAKFPHEPTLAHEYAAICPKMPREGQHRGPSPHITQRLFVGIREGKQAQPRVLVQCSCELSKRAAFDPRLARNPCS